MAKDGESLGLGELLPVAEELVARVGWLIRLRWLAVAGVLCLLEVARRVFALELALQPLYLTITALAAYNLILTLVFRRLRRRRRDRASHRSGLLARRLLAESATGFEPRVEAFEAGLFASGQIAIDLLFLAILLHFSGGIENPFVVFFIFHVIVASILLSRLATFFHATLGLALASCVALGELFGILPHYPLHDALQVGAYRDPTVVAVVLFVLAGTLYLSAYLGSAIAGHPRELAEKARLFEAAYQRASESERAKSQYMRKVAHELRGPVGTIQTELKVVLQELAGEIPESLRELMSRAEQRAGEVAQVTLDLLTLSRAREAPLEVEMMEVEPAKLVAEVVDQLSGTAERAGVTLSTSIPRRLGTFRADPDGLRQLVGNLLGNAIRYSPGGGQVEVRLA
ncbi:MAG: hypothetical protein JSV41_02245, partial [Gemmatimonadota bacterium]